MPAAREIHISVSTTGGSPESAANDLQTAIANVGDGEDVEIWVDHDPYPAMCVLASGPRAFLMYLRSEGDAGFSSRNPAHGGESTEMVDFWLSNGQLDRYPVAWTYPRSEALAALEFFATNRRPPDSMVWFNDSGDGAPSPGA